MAKRSTNYWQKRFTAVEDQMNKQSKSVVNRVTPAFDKAESEIQSQINDWYQRFADNNEISLAEAKKMLTAKELKELKWDVDEYIKYGRQNALDQTWMKELENASAKYHISRLEALKIRTQQAAEVAFGKEQNELLDAVKNAYTEDYYHTAFEIQSGLGLGWDVGYIDQKKLDKLIQRPWTADGKTFSNRIWKSKAELLDSLHTELTQMCILGKTPDEAISNIAKRLNVSRSQSARLVMTECSYFASQAQKDCFNDLDVEMYEIVATLDNRTSKICQQMDGKVFKMSEFEAGVTAPPFHVYCRSTTVPYFDDFNEGSTRAARGEDGKTYQVPANMKYEDWKKSFVQGGSKANIPQFVDPEEIKKQIQSKQAEIDDLKKQIKDLNSQESDIYIDQHEFRNGQKWYSKYINMTDEEWDAYQKSVIDKEAELTKLMDDYQKQMDALFDKDGKWISNSVEPLTQAEKDAVEYYVSGDGMYINQDLRNKVDLDPDALEYQKTMDSAISKFNVEKDTLYRSVDASAVFGDMSDMDYDHLRSKLIYNDWDAPKAQIPALEKKFGNVVGKEITELGYMSTTESIDVAEEFGDFTGSGKPIILKFKNAKDLNGFPVKDFFEVEGDEQYEVLLQRNLKYKVDKVYAQDGSIFVDCEFIDKPVSKGFNAEAKYDELSELRRQARKERSEIRDEISKFGRYDSYRSRFNGKTEKYFDDLADSLKQQRLDAEKKVVSLQDEIKQLQDELKKAEDLKAQAEYSTKTLAEIQKEINDKFDSILKTQKEKDQLNKIVSDMDKEHANLYNRLSVNAPNNNYYEKKTGWYAPYERKIHMDLDNNHWAKDVGRPDDAAWKTKFHEEFHQLDHILALQKSPFAQMEGMSGGYMTKITNTMTVTGKKMIKSIDEDVVNLINKAVDWNLDENGVVAKKITKLDRIPTDTKGCLIDYLKDKCPTPKDRALIDTVTDAIGLTTKGNLHPYSYGFWGHDASYSRARGKDGATSELWANIGGFLMRNDTEALDAIKEMMPNTIDTYTEVFNEVVEYAKTHNLTY